MTRLIPKVMLFMMVVSLLFIATAAANSLMPMHYESIIIRGEPTEPREPYVAPTEPYVVPPKYYDYIIERIQSHSHGIIRIIPYDSRVAQITIPSANREISSSSESRFFPFPITPPRRQISGNFPGLADGYNSDRQDLFNDFRTRV